MRTPERNPWSWRWPLLLAALVTLPLAGCPEDKEPSFPDVGEIDLSGRDITVDRSEDEVDLGEPRACDNHLDCETDELCFEDVCVDRDEALDDCADDNDCPDGFVCEEQDRCVEE